MSGPVSPVDDTVELEVTGPAGMEITTGRRTAVGGMPILRTLPQRRRRTVGAWCFADHFGPSDVAETSMQVGPHPHVGLHTVTWVLDGEIVHHDSLGSEQLIRPGQLNLMTAGRGVAHAEETPKGAAGVLHGLQLWVAQPDATRSGPPGFEHHPSLPEAEVGPLRARILVGELAGVRSPARAETPLLGADVVVAADASLPLDPGFEHAVLVVDGPLSVDGSPVAPGSMAYVAPGRSELGLAPGPGAAGPARAVLLGGAPFDEPIAMWWNFVARTKDELVEARTAWEASSNGEDSSDRFGEVESRLGRITAPPLLPDRAGMPATRK